MLPHQPLSPPSPPPPHEADIPPQVPVWDQAIEDCSMMKPTLFIMPLSNFLSTNVAQQLYYISCTHKLKAKGYTYMVHTIRYILQTNLNDLSQEKMCIYNHCNLEIYTNFAINGFFCKQCNSKMQQKHNMGDLPRLLARPR